MTNVGAKQVTTTRPPAGTPGSSPPPHRPGWGASERRVAVGGLLTVAVSFGFARYGYGLFLPDIRRDYDLSIATLGLIGSATYVGYLFALVVVAVVGERLGPRLLVGVGGFAATAGMGLVAGAWSAGALTVGLVLAGTSAAWAWAPYSEAVDRMVEPVRRDVVLALIPAGTALGTALVGPLALLSAGTAWRTAWAAMAGSAALVTAYNVRVLPGPRRTPPGQRQQGSQPGLGWLRRPGTIPLYATAVSYGLIGSFYWYFATETLTDTSVHPISAQAVFWTVLGVAGLGGGGAGFVLARLGLRRTARLLFSLLAVAVGLLGLAAGSLAASWVSALVFGPTFMAVSSLLAVWSYRVFPELPAAGLSTALLFLGLGTVIGPATLGVLAERTDLRVAFLVAAGVSLITAGIRAPR